MKSLAARAFWLIALLLAVSLASGAWLFRQAEQQARADQLARMVVSVVNLTRAAVLSADPSLRAALLAELTEAEGLRIQPVEHDEVLAPLPQEGDLLTEKIRGMLGGNTRFAAGRNGQEGFWVSFLIGSDEFWVALPQGRVASQPILQWLGTAALVLVLALAGGALIARQVGRPLTLLFKATQALGRGETPPPLPESGAEETAAVAAAFNRMAADLAAMERERALVLAGISHDLRTPLTRLRLAAEFVDEKAGRNGMVRDLEEMDAIVGQFLDYARLGSQEAPEPTDLCALVVSVAESHRARCVELNLALGDPTILVLRPMLVKRALTNLMENAIRYGGGRVDIGLEAQPGGGVVLSVGDRGPGIPVDQLEAAKRPFVRLEASRPGAGGSGLGLAIVEQAARLHGGSFTIAPRPGGGLAATLTLPRQPPLG